MKILQANNCFRRQMREIVVGHYTIAFILSFFLVFTYILPLHDLIPGKGDAYSIWQTIVSFHENKITSSYVLYKGFLSVYPYVWLYDWAKLLGQDSFLFIKLYHSFLFAYVSAIGVPYVVSELLSVKLRVYRNIVFVSTIFIMFKFTNIFSMLMIDLPSWTYFVAGIASVIKLSKKNANPSKFYFFLSGLLVGLSLCASGQYTIAAFLLILYVAITRFDLKSLKEKNVSLAAFVLFSVFIAGVLIPKAYDSYFEKSIVKPMRDRGDWLPSGQEWLINGMTRLLPQYKYSPDNPIPSNRGLAILKETEGNNFTHRYELIKLGGGSYSVAEYLHIIKNNAFDFLVMWGAKTFIALSFDGGHAKISHLLISYSALFVCFYFLYSRCKRVRDFLNTKTVIFIAIVSTIAAPVFLFIDMRYGVTLQSFIIGIALFDDYIWVRLKNCLNVVATVSKTNKFKPVISQTVPYQFITFSIYLLFCFMLYGAFLEISSSNPYYVLFNF